MPRVTEADSQEPRVVQLGSSWMSMLMETRMGIKGAYGHGQEGTAPATFTASLHLQRSLSPEIPEFSRKRGARLQRRTETSSSGRTPERQDLNYAILTSRSKRAVNGSQLQPIAAALAIYLYLHVHLCTNAPKQSPIVWQTQSQTQTITR
jgi:hypothetical protein